MIFSRNQRPKKKTPNPNQTPLQRIGTFNYRTLILKATIRDAEDIASELIALVCSIKLITEGSLCPKTAETVLLADTPVRKYPPRTAFFSGLQGIPRLGARQ